MKNPFTSDFVETLQHRYPTDGVDMGYADWITTNTHYNGKEFSFEGYEFQKAIMDDMAKDLVVIKPSQVGMSEGQIRKFGAFLVRNRGTSGIFTLPNEKMMKRLSKTRIGPLFKSERAFAQSAFDEKPLQAMDLYELNGSFAYITGMTEGDATSIAADILLHDELDLSNSDMIALFQSRLQNSDWKITQSFSTPSHPGFGVDGLYLTSNKTEYHLRCDCNHWQIPLFNPNFVKSRQLPDIDHFSNLDQELIDSLDPSELKVVCERCGKPLNFRDPSRREWVSEHPGRRRHGYRIRPFSTHRLPAEYIFGQLSKYKVREKLKGFFNTVLGEAWSDGSNQFDEASVTAAMDSAMLSEIGPSVPCAIGIDIGATCHLIWGPIVKDVVQAARWKICKIEELPGVVADIMKNYRIVAGAVDRFPYTPDANRIFQQSGKIIVPVQYRGTLAVNIHETEFEELSHASADRTSMIDSVVSAIRNGRLRMSGFGHFRQTIIEHLCDMVRVEKDENPAVWEKLTGADHFFHALAFAHVSTKIHKLILLRDDAETESVMLDLEGISEDDDENTSPIRTNRLGFRGAMSSQRFGQRN